MKVEYLGHSCFRFTESTDASIVTDPYESCVGYAMPKGVKSDIVTVSHKHKDHSFIRGVKAKTVINEEGKFNVEGVKINGIKSYHDDEGGAKRGENLIFKFRMDGIDVCHLGDLGEECTSELLEMILPVNILCIPVGGNYTIDAEQAKEYVDRIMPDVVIPMHYRSKKCKYDIDKEDKFLALFDKDEIVECEEGEMQFKRDEMDGESTKVIVMQRKENL